MRSVPVQSYSYCTIFMSVCLSIRARSGDAWERVSGGNWHVHVHTYMYGVSWFVRLLAATESQAMSVLSTVEAQLSLYKRSVAKAAPEEQEWQKPTANYEQDKVRNSTGVTVPCVL